jgi:hypothetical protein
MQVNPSIVKQPNNWVTWLRDRIPVAAGHYRQLRDDEYRWAMVISGVSDLQLLSDVNEAIAQQLADPRGSDYRTFQRNLAGILDRYGWTGLNPTRRRLIWHMATGSAYADGRWYKLTDPDVLAGTGAWKWNHRWPQNPRLNHLAIDGNLYPPGTIDYDGEGYPPSEYFCHCVITMVPLSEANLLPHSTPPRSRPGRAPHDRAVVLGRLLDRLPDDAKSKFRQYVRQNQETIEVAIVEGDV